MSAREFCWWHINGFLNNVTRKQLPQMKCFISFLARTSAPTMNDHIRSFNSQPLISCPWLPNQGDLVDKMSEANLQADSQMDKPAQGVVDLWETEDEDSSPHCSPVWSPIQRPLLGCLNMKHCLEI